MFEALGFDSLGITIGTALVFIYYVTVAAIIVIIIMENRKPERTMAWILVLIFLPVLGLVLYLLFGQNWRKTKFLSKKSVSDDRLVARLKNQQLEMLANGEISLQSEVDKKRHIIQFLLNSSKSILTRYNKATILHNGEETFAEIIDALQNAKRFIHIEYYIFARDNIGNTIRDILIRKAEEGVEVRMIFDDVGSWNLNKRYVRDLRKQGIRIYPFLPVSFPLLTSKINYRNHRKIIVVDGKIGFVGGINVADRYIEGTKRLGFWRDTHLKIDGDATKALQLVFAVDWNFVSGELLSFDKYYPDYHAKEKCLIQVASSGPDSDSAHIEETFFSAIATAQKSVYISTPYFLPTSSIMMALKTAKYSGIDVKILLPRKSDGWLVQQSSMSFVKPLLEAGIEVYLYHKGFTHAKILIVDGILSTVGTANMDYRSFEVNLEVNAIIYDTKISRTLEDQFFDDLRNSELLSLSKWARRPLHHKFLHSIARIFSPLL